MGSWSSEGSVHGQPKPEVAQRIAMAEHGRSTGRGAEAGRETPSKSQLSGNTACRWLISLSVEKQLHTPGDEWIWRLLPSQRLGKGQERRAESQSSLQGRHLSDLILSPELRPQRAPHLLRVLQAGDQQGPWGTFEIN